MNKKNEKYQPIENYGVIGNLHTVALVSLNGSIDFMSFPRFDSPTIFASLLEAERGGRFSLQPVMNEMSGKQLYLLDTAILLTRFFSVDGIAEITDYMPVMQDENGCTLIRKVKTVRGKINYRMICSPRFNYAQTHHHLTKENDDLIFEPGDKIQQSVRLSANVPLSANDGDGWAEFTLDQSETAWFVLENISDKTLRSPSVDHYVEESYKTTILFWKNWISQSRYKGRWREIVNRSAITLKLLTSVQYGSTISAATFGLPETVGGIRNWDYRYTWTRDAAFTMYVFLKLGFIKEAEDFISWIRKQCINRRLELMYSIDGATDLKEYVLKDFEGYKGSVPVRIGNAAHGQFQLDIYGELIDTIYLFNKDGGSITFEFWKEIEGHVDFVIHNWKKPDHSIWEIRNQEREFLYSRMMCWVALDRAIKIAEERSFPYPFLQWHKVRDEIFYDIYNNFWDEKKQTYVQYKGSDAVDASILLMPLKRIISPVDKRWLSTMKAIDKELRLDVLVYRYRDGIENIDGIAGDEGTFTMCSFWFVECLAKSGYTERAKEDFEKMLGYANHLGLYSEELGIQGEHLGNFPQGFTHLALISAVIQLHRSMDESDGHSFREDE
jgi:GH15 family glucan-1,4-alpha-glucosidase